VKLGYSAQMREMDRQVIEDRGVSGVALMASAAEHIAEAVLQKIPPGGHAAAVCGAGNNGGDGIGAAAFLMDKGVPIRVFLIGDAERISPDSSEMARLLEERGGKLERFGRGGDDLDEIEYYLRGCDVIIDAMFGIGLNHELSGDALLAAEIINDSRAFVVAADIPSGIRADTGTMQGTAVMADMTVTFSLAKPGHFVEPGCVHCGELRVCDIGIPLDVINGAMSDTFAVMQEDIYLPRRRPDSHKGNYGRCLVVSGSVGYTGAPALAARAASRMGAGLVFVGVPDSVYDIMATKLDEEMPFPLPSDGSGKIAANAGGELLRRAEECDVCLIGPGLGRSPDISELVTSMLRIVQKPIVLDADGINAIADNIDVLGAACGPLVLTPHPGEFARLGGDLSSGDRLGVARDFARSRGCILVLKGHNTITAFPDGMAFINTTGGPAMAKGGSGDVLAGMIAALIGQGVPARDAVVAAVYIHGFAGDLCAAELGEYSVAAGDIVAMLPRATKLIMNGIS